MADQPNVHHPAPPTRSRATAWAAYTACALAWLYAVPSFYWALGGTAGLHTLGGAIEELARTRDPAGVALGIGAGLLKVAGGLLALALVRPWGRAIPGRLLGDAGCAGGAPAPSPQLQRLDALVGRWRSEGHIVGDPCGPDHRH